MEMLRHMDMFYLASIYIYLYVYEKNMHMLKYHESFKMCKECICVLIIK